MPYTLWSKGRLVGHTDLGFVETTPGVRFGWFHPTEAGQPICDLINAPRLVMLRAAQRGDNASLEADMEIASRGIEELELELRAEDGSIVKTEDLSVRDMEITMQYGELANHDEDEPLDDELEAAIAHDLELLDFEEASDADAELEPLPRYQIIAYMKGHARSRYSGQDERQYIQ